MLFYFMILGVSLATEWHLALGQQLQHNMSHVDLHINYQVLVVTWNPGYIDDHVLINYSDCIHLYKVFFFFRVHLWLYSFHCITALEAFVLGFCPETPSWDRLLSRDYKFGATDTGSLTITEPTSSTFSGWLLEDYWFKRMNNKWLTRELLEESKLLQTILPYKDYILRGK